MTTEIGVPDYISPIVGYRAWFLHKGTYQLMSLNKCVWPFGEECEADCERNNYRHVVSHEAPGEVCSCGIYAARDLDHLISIGYVGGKDYEAKVYGPINLWGNIWEHELGYRAQFAYPKSINIPAKFIRTDQQQTIHFIDSISKYGVPLYLNMDEKFLAKLELLWNKDDGIQFDVLHRLYEARYKSYQRIKRNIAEQLVLGARVMINSDIVIVSYYEPSVSSVVELSDNNYIWKTKAEYMDYSEVNSFWHVSNHKCTRVKRRPVG